MARIQVPRFIHLAIRTAEGDPVEGLVLGDFEVQFYRDGLPCLDTLTLTDGVSGADGDTPSDANYTLQYVPSQTGVDYLELYHLATDTRVIDEELITPIDLNDVLESVGVGSTVTLSDQYTVGLVLTVKDPEFYTVYAFNSEDWNIGIRSVDQAVGSTPVGTDGRWVSDIDVAEGTYHVVAIKNGVLATMIVLRANLVVSL